MHSPAAEQEPAEVLISLLRVDLAIGPGVGSVGESAVCLAHVGVLDENQPVAFRPDGQARQPVILRIGADQAEDVVGGEDIFR
jgi:hypothetical protein